MHKLYQTSYETLQTNDENHNQHQVEPFPLTNQNGLRGNNIECLERFLNDFPASRDKFVSKDILKQNSSQPNIDKIISVLTF